MAITAELEQLLRYTNPWLWEPDTWRSRWAALLPTGFVRRSAPGWDGQLRSDRATLVVGPRRAGKTTLLWNRLGDLGPAILHVNCEEPLFRAWCRSPGRFLSDLAALLPRPAALMFDEVQHLSEAGLFLKGLVDARPGCPILATGSSSYHLLAGTRESLAGRATRVQLLPFGLLEVCADLGELPPLIREHRRRERAERMLLWGGYPEVWLGQEPRRVLVELVEGVVVRDASDLFRIDAPEPFRRLARLMATEVGNLVNLAEWASICGVSAKTVARYASILDEAHVARLVSPWLSGKRAELTSTPKVFFVDNGVRNALCGRLMPLEERDDLGPLLENWVFGELAKVAHPLLDSVGYWRTRSGAEVDFVWQRGGRVVALEVKAGAGRRRLTRAARSFIDAARPEVFVTAWRGGHHEEHVGGCRVLWVPASELPTLLRELAA